MLRVGSSLLRIGIAAGFLHAATSLLESPLGPGDPATAAILGAGNAVLFGLAGLLLAPLAAALLGAAGSARSALGWGLSLAGVVLVALAPLREAVLAELAAPVQAAVAGVALVAVVLAAFLAARQAHALEPHAARLLRAAPLCALWTAAFVWAQMFAVVGATSGSSLAAAAGWLAACAVTLWLAGGLAVDVALVPALASVVWLWPRVAEPPPSQTERPPVVLMSIDTLRADALRAYRAGAASAPEIDALLDDSVVFLDARSPAPWTVASFASLMTGLSPVVHGAVRSDSQLDARLSTLAERLRDAGYATGAFGYNWFLTPQFGLDRGFDTYRFFPAPSLGRSEAARLLPALWPTRFPPSDPSQEQVTDMALEWLEVHREVPFFLWVHWFDPHLPYSPPQAFVGDDPRAHGRPIHFDDLRGVRTGSRFMAEGDRDWLRALYEAELRAISVELGRLVEALREGGLWDRAVVVFLSDHGEEFWEHGGFEHGHSVYDELLRVPFAMRLPGGSPGRIAAPVTTQSLTPTLLEILGLDPLEVSTAPSLVPLLAGRDATTQGAFVSGGTLFYGEQLAVIRGDEKFVLGRDGEEAVYDLARDPGELRPSDAEGDFAEFARGELERHRRIRATLGLPDDQPGRVLDPETEAGLRALGYVE